MDWFPGKPCVGNRELIASEFPFLSTTNLASYLTRKRCEWPHPGNVPAREGDEFKKFDECAVIDFMRFLKVGVEVRDRYVRFLSPEYRKFDVLTSSYTKQKAGG